MAEDKDLIFPMKLELDVNNFATDWKKIEPKLQAVLDKNPLKARIDIDEAKLKNAIAQLSKLQAAGSVPKQSSQAAMLTAEMRTRIMWENHLTKARQQGTIELDRARIAAANAEKAELSLERAKQRGIAAVHTQNKAYQAQRGILNGLPQFINSYVSILGAYRLGQNIVDTTAEFEMQRVALAAIIQDKQKADQLFAQNVELGLQSPFQIKELITYTKQLAAFRIETDQLFDTTKRLADVSAGLGVDMGRLILAYGQVRAASVLRGQEIRQMTEAGIPIIQLLADKFTKLNGTATSTADVFKLISERAVSFEMVKEVFEDMTNAGGTFYRMQEIQATTLKGSLSNLTDAYQKMFMEIGNANMGTMKSAINGIRELMENWEAVGNVLTDAAVGYGIAKVAILAYNAALGKENAANIASIMTAKKKEAVLLTQSTAYKTLNAQELTKIATSRKMTVADWEQLVVAGKLTEADVLRLVAVRKMTPEMANQLIATEAVTKAEWKLTAAQIGTAASSNKLTVAFRLMTASAWAATKALLKNPLTWVVVAVAGVVKLTASIINYNRKYSEMAKDIRKESSLLANEMTDAWGNMSETIEKGLKAGASSESMVSARKSLQDILSKNELIRDVLNERLKAIDDEAVKLGIVKDMWDTVHEAAKGGGGDMALAQKDTGNWLNADVVDNAKKFNDLLDKTDKYLSDMSEKGIYVTKIRKEFESLREQINKGEISLSDFRKGLYNTFYDNRPFQKSVEFANKLYKFIRNTSASAVNLDADMNNFMQSYIARAGEIEGQMPMLNAENMGLTPAALNTYHAALSTQSNLWFNTLGDDIDAGTKRVLISLIKLKNAFPKLDSGDTLPETPFIQSYNAFIKIRGLSVPMLEMPKAGDVPTDRSQREKIGEQLKSDKERLAEVKSMLQNRGVLTAELLSELSKEKEKLEKSVSENDQIWRILLGGTYNTTTTRPSTDPRIAALKGQLDLVVDAYENYLKRVKQVGETQARADVEGIYGGQNAEIKGITSGLPLAFTPEGLNAVIEQAKAGFGTLGKDAMATLRGVILKQNDENFEDLTRNFKENLDRLAAEIQQTQRANEFYEKMLGLTGSAEMAKRLTEAMGMTVGDVREGMYSALREIMGTAGDGVNLSDVNAVNKAISGLPETIRKAAQGQLAEIIDYEQKQLEEYLNFQNKLKEMAKRLTEAMGMTVGDVREGMYSALREIMGTAGDGVNLSDVNAVNKAISGLPETIRKAAQGQLAEIIDYEQKQLEEYLNFQNKLKEMALESPFLGTGAGFDVSKLAVNTSAQIAEQKKIHNTGLALLKAKADADEKYKKDGYEADVAYANKVFNIKIENIKTEANEKLRSIAATYVKERLQSAGLGEDAMTNLSQKSLTQLNSNLEKLKMLQDEIRANKTILPDDIKVQLDAAGLSLEGFISEVEKLINLDISDNVQQKTEDIKKSVEEILSSLSQIGNAITQLGKTTGNTSLAGLGDVISDVSDLVSTVGQDIASGNYVKAAIDVLMKIGTEIIADIQHVEELKNAIRDTVREMNKMKIQDLRKNEDADSIFGANYWDNVSSTVSAINLAKSKYDETLAAAQEASSKGRQDWYFGAALFLLHTTYAITRVADGLKGLEGVYKSIEDFTFKSNDKSGFMNLLGVKDKFTTIKDAAKELGVELYGADGALNPTALKLIYDTYASEMDETQKAWFEDAIMYAEEYKLAMEELEKSIETMFGQIAGSIADAFMSNYGSIVDTAKAIENVFDDLGNSITKSIIESFIIEQYLNKYKQQIEDVYADTSKSAEQKGIALAQIYTDMAADIKTSGYADISSFLSIFKDKGIYTPSGQDKSLTGISASVAAMSEDTANTLGGYLNMGLMQWVQQTNLQTQILAAIQTQDIKTPMANLFELQQQSLAAINAIKSDTAKLVLSNAEIVSMMKSVLNGTGTKGLNVYLRN